MRALLSLLPVKLNSKTRTTEPLGEERREMHPALVHRMEKNCVTNPLNLSQSLAALEKTWKESMGGFYM